MIADKNQTTSHSRKGLSLARYQTGELNDMKWISIRSKLPGKDERVLFYTPYAIFGKDHTCVGDSECISSCKTEIGGEMVAMFTHWMPLPKGPDSP